MVDKDVYLGKENKNGLYRKAQSGMHINDSRELVLGTQLLNSTASGIVSALFVYGMHPIHFCLVISLLFPFAKWAVFVSGRETAHWTMVLVCNSPSDSTCPTWHVGIMQCLSNDPLCFAK